MLTLKNLRQQLPAATPGMGPVAGGCPTGIKSCTTVTQMEAVGIAIAVVSNLDEGPQRNQDPRGTECTHPNPQPLLSERTPDPVGGFAPAIT
jgi:hypothetical protein